MEKGKIPPSEIILVEIEEEEIHAAMSVPPLSPRNERRKKSPEGSTTLGGNWKEMVKHRKVLL